VYGLIDRGHRYIINVRGPKEVKSSEAATIQVVPAYSVYDDGELGMTVHMPFDPESGTFGELVRFLDTQGHEDFDEYRHDGIPCFAINLGRDVDLAARVLLYLLEKVHEYPTGTSFLCEVHDEGPSDENREDRTSS
jgi:hypothetical protein